MTQRLELQKTTQRCAGRRPAVARDYLLFPGGDA